MILIDANLLVYARISDYAQHEPARRWLDERLNGQARVGLNWASLLAFYRISTSRRIFEEPLSVADAWSQVEAWLDQPTSWIPEATFRHRQVLAEWVKEVRFSGRLTPDAHLAALAVEHNLTRCSADSDFMRFPGLKWQNPLA